MWISLLFISICLFILYLIYRKRQAEESSLFLKLLVYSFLGAFTFSINGLKLPVGFVICLFMLAQAIRNKRVKQWATLFGLALFLFQFIAPGINKYWFERPQSAAIVLGNLDTADFEQQWLVLAKQLDVDANALLRGFKLTYEADGQVSQMEYELEVASQSQQSFVMYRVKLNEQQDKLIINRYRVEGQPNYNNQTIRANYFFTKLNELEWGNLGPVEQDYPYYMFATEGGYVSYSMKGTEKVAIEDNILYPLTDEQLPVSGYWMSVCGMQVNLYCEERVDYFFDAVYGKDIN